MLDKNHPDYIFTCTLCKKDLPNYMYHKMTLSTDGHKRKRWFHSRCKECILKVGKQRKLNGLDKLAPKRWKLKYLYGITYEQYLDLLKRQDNKCAICLKERSHDNTLLCVDHCHDTGKVRGLLCKSCNLAIANLKYSVNNCKRAIKYINKHI